ncbi:uncharacterized protein clnk [Aplochiton taeniatus]
MVSNGTHAHTLTCSTGSTPLIPRDVSGAFRAHHTAYNYLCAAYARQNLTYWNTSPNSRAWLSNKESCKSGNKSKQRYGRYSNVEEREYHFVDNREEMFNVAIQPAKPLLSEKKYADRCPARSSPAMKRVKSRRQQHHEWPQTKEDFDQHDFIPKEKPCQVYDEQDWYIGAFDRAEAEHALHLVNKDGAFLVRTCSKYTPSEPYVLAVYHEKKVYNIKIRFLDGTNKYALGTGQRANDMFDSVADIIKFHTIFPIVLIDGRSMSTIKYPGNCLLTYPITKEDVDKLLG